MKTATVTTELTFAGEAEIRRMIARNSRRINHVSKGHTDPLLREGRIWSCAMPPTSVDILDLESHLRCSDDVCAMALNDKRMSRHARTDLKRGKVRATASVSEKAKMLKTKMDDCSWLIHNKIYCRKYGRAKVLFETRDAAERYIEYMNTFRPGANQLFTYYCEHCQCWHITSLWKYKHLVACPFRR